MTNDLPFQTELPDGYEEYQEDIVFDVWVCTDCDKQESEDCDCHAEFEKVETIFRCWRTQQI